MAFIAAYLMWWIAFWVFIMVVTGKVASARNRSVFWWVVCAVLFGPIGTIAVAILPKLPEAEEPTGEEM